MASPVKLYQREMHDNLGFFATWLPGDPIEIGDVGLLEAGRFRRMGSLKELDIPCEVDIGSTRQDVQLTSTRGTKLTTSAGADAQAILRAEVAIEFSRAGAFIFNASGLRPQHLVNRSAVAEAILNAYRNDRWEQDWLLVESLHTAERATILVSEDSSAEVVLVAKVSGALSAVSLADPKVSFAVASTKGKIVHVVGGRGLRPLYSCLRIKTPLFDRPSVRPVRGISTEPALESVFRHPSVDELLES
jgi:hypothetical protein